MLDIEDNKIVAEVKVIPPPHKPGSIPKWLIEKGVSDVLALGMGDKAIKILNHNNVNVFVGAPKLTAQEITKGFLSETIEFTPNGCNH